MTPLSDYLPAIFERTSDDVIIQWNVVLHTTLAAYEADILEWLLDDDENAPGPLYALDFTTMSLRPYTIQAATLLYNHCLAKGFWPGETLANWIDTHVAHYVGCATPYERLCDLTENDQ